MSPPPNDVRQSPDYQRLRYAVRLLQSELGVYRGMVDQVLHQRVTTGMPEVLSDALDAVITIFRASRGFILLFSDPEALMARPRLWVGRNADREDVDLRWQEVSMTVVSAATEGRTVVQLEDAVRDGPFSTEKSVQALGLRSVLCVPFDGGEGPCPGVIYLEDRKNAGTFKSDRLEKAAVLFDRIGRWVRFATGLSENEGGGDHTTRWREVGGDFQGLIGHSGAWAEVLRQLLVAFENDDSVVVIRGPAGSGRRLVSRIVHRNSRRASGPLEQCPAGSARTLAQWGSVLERSHAGTLVVQDLDTLSPEAQEALLGAWRERPRTALPRLIGTCSQDLEHARESGAVSDELLRLFAGQEVRLPRLRERGRDASVLAEFFLSRPAGPPPEGRSRHPRYVLSARAAAELLLHEWPGEVAELREVVERARRAALVRSDGRAAELNIEADDLGLGRSVVSNAPVGTWDEEHQRLRRRLLERAMEEAGGGIEEAARLLDISRQHMSRQLRTHELYHLRSNQRGRKPREVSGK